MARNKTTVDVTEKSLVLSKIVKFTYLQSLAVDGGLTTVGEIGGETEAKQEENVDVNTRLDGVSRSISKTDSSVLSVIFSTPYFPGVGDAIAKVATAVFGKKRSTSVKTDYKESGWTVSKVWNQPQFDIIQLGSLYPTPSNAAYFTSI